MEMMMVRKSTCRLSRISCIYSFLSSSWSLTSSATLLNRHVSASSLQVPRSKFTHSSAAMSTFKIASLQKQKGKEPFIQSGDHVLVRLLRGDIKSIKVEENTCVKSCGLGTEADYRSSEQSRYPNSHRFTQTNSSENPTAFPSKSSTRS